MDSEIWAEKYRPKSFADVVGQERAVTQLRSLVESGTGRSVILSGPSGTGKTTLALIYAQAAMCLKPSTPAAACGVCHSCKDWAADWQPAFHQINCGTDGNVESIRYLIDEQLQYKPMGSLRHAVFLDEAHRLSLAAREALLVPLEKRTEYVVFILGLIDPTALPRPFRDRCRQVALDLSSISARLTFLERISRSENLSSDVDALELLARHTPSFRALAERLQALVAESGGSALTKPLVAALLLKEGPGAILGYLTAAVSGDLDRQLFLLRETGQPLSDKLASLRKILNHLKLRYVGPSIAKSAEVAFDGLLDPEQCREIVAGLAKRAAWLGVSDVEMFDQVLDFWSFLPGEITDLELETQAIRFHDRLVLGLGQNAPADLRSAREALGQLRKGPQSRKYLKHAPKWALPGSRGEYISAQQAQEIYEAATFLMQRYGVTFNAWVEIRHAELGIDTDSAAAELMSALGRELGQLLKSWAGSDAKGNGSGLLHRIMVHERQPKAGLVSSMVLHVPEGFEARVEAWIFDKFLSRHAPQSWGLDRARSFGFDPHRKRSGQVDAHWALVQRLWRGLDPETRVGSDALIDLLGVPARSRRPAGLVSGRRFAVSQSLSVGKQLEEGDAYLAHLSAWRDQAWKHVLTGWELDVHEERERQLSERAKFAAEVEQDLAKTSDSMTRQNLVSLRGNVALGWQQRQEFRQIPWVSSPERRP